MSQDLAANSFGQTTRRRLMVGLPVLILAAVSGGSFLYWLRSEEANAAMQATPAPIEGERAYQYLKQLCEIGPRVAGSEANTRQRKLVADHFRKQGGIVREQPFDAPHPLTGQPVRMANLIASWFPDRESRVVIGAHYDTRPYPDEERDANKRRAPFLGANDGASGVALLMEIANHLPTMKTSWGVDLVLFDGEELVYGRQPYEGEYFLGSKAFGKEYAEQLDAGQIRYRYAAGMVLDMVAGKNLEINQEPYSLEFAPGLVREVWGVAHRLRVNEFKDRIGRAVLDDHLPLNNAGIPTIDIIDFEYPHWHKATDLPENCSARSLAKVGQVITAWLTQPPARRRGR